jgi:hypothetical protein
MNEPALTEFRKKVKMLMPGIFCLFQQFSVPHTNTFMVNNDTFLGYLLEQKIVNESLCTSFRDTLKRINEGHKYHQFSNGRYISRQVFLDYLLIASEEYYGK